MGDAGDADPSDRDAMPTPSEQKALAFLAFVILLGGAVRVVRAGDLPAPTSVDEQALARQAAATDSAARTKRARKPRKSAGLSRLRRDGGADTVAGVAGVPFSDVRPDRPDASRSGWVPRDGWVNGYPPPSPRIDVDNRPGIQSRVGEPRAAVDQAGRRPSGKGAGSAPVDLDHATAEEIATLPRIGPATAARIVASRDSSGPFRSLEGLRRVRGMGPATLRLIAPRVTFSGRAASVNAGGIDR
jgi:competence ComEA-like helix-hairpin-helix protein